jgi:hypothetical protein
LDRGGLGGGEGLRGLSCKGLMGPVVVVQRGLRTPTGPFYARYYIGIILGSVAMFVFMGPSTKRMALFSAALWIVRELIAGWKFRPGCSTGPHVLMNCG